MQTPKYLIDIGPNGDDNYHSWIKHNAEIERIYKLLFQKGKNLSDEIAKVNKHLTTNNTDIAKNTSNINANKESIATVSKEVTSLKASVGTPLVAVTAAAMTDKNKIYVYAGSEANYIKGNWYYNDGTKWVSGGVYNSEGFTTDKTLTVPGAVADSAVVGEILSQLNDTVGVEKPTVIKLVTGGFRLSDGLVYTTNKTLQTEKLIHLSVGDIVTSSNINMQYAWRRYSDSEEKNFIDATLNGFASKEYVADKDAWYKFMFRYRDNTDVDLTDKIDSMQKELRIIYETQNSTLPRKISDLEKNVANLKDVTDEDMDTLLQKNYHDKVKTSEVSVSNMDAYGLNPDMTTINNSSLRHFVLTDVSEGDIITVSSVMEKNGVKQHFTVNINAVVAFYDDALLVSKGKQYNIKAPSFQIPSKINKVIITCSPILSYPNVAITITKPNAVVERIVKQKKQGKPFIYKGAMNKGDVISLGFENVWTNKIWMFTGLLTSAFKSTKIGAYNNGEIVRPYIEITPTHVNVYSSISRFDSTFEHGLTIEKDFQVIVEQGRSLYNKRLIIQSNGKRWV